MVDRHPMLRAVVSADGTQRVLESVPRTGSPSRTCGETATDTAARLADWRGELSHQVLPADRWPLFDVRASLLPGGDTLLHVSVDALVCDAHSFGLVMAELTDRATGRSANSSASSPIDSSTGREALRRSGARVPAA
ncbi:hypothetical protein NKH77_07515 [Streptomyces sp. M19]